MPTTAPHTATTRAIMHSLTYNKEVTAVGRWGKLAQRGIEVQADPSSPTAITIGVFGRDGSTDRVKIQVPWEELDRLADLLRVLARRAPGSAA